MVGMVGANQGLLNIARAVTPVKINETVSLNNNSDNRIYQSGAKPVLYLAVMPTGASVDFVVEEGPFEGADEKSFQEVSSGTILNGESSIISADSAGAVIRVTLTSAGETEVLMQGAIH